MKSVREMTDLEFKALTRFTRKEALTIMNLHRFSPIPDRPMHPDAVMAGGEELTTEQFYRLQDYFRNHDSKVGALRRSMYYKSADDIGVSGVIENGV